jgi:hypothetical protein
MGRVRGEKKGRKEEPRAGRERRRGTRGRSGPGREMGHARVRKRKERERERAAVGLLGGGEEKGRREEVASWAGP